MSRPFTIRPEEGRFTGYVADPSQAPPDKLSYPSQNCMINENGEVEQRLGFTLTDIELNQPNKPARPFYIEKYDVTVFTIADKVLYYDWNTSEVYDTGLTMTDGTICRGDEFEGDLYITNTTDGERRIIFGRLRGQATAGALTMDIDYDAAARLERFGKTNGDIVVQGTTEVFSNASTASGNVTTTALTQGYADNAVFTVIHDISGVSGIEKASKVFFFKRRHGSFGSEIAGNSDQPNNTIYYGKFAAPTDMENLLAFDYATGGSTRELVGNYGRVTNVIPAQNYLYQFTSNEAYITAAADIIIVSGGLGTTTPDIRDPDHGCFNEDCASTLGNDEISYIDAANKRIMRIKVDSSTGQAREFPDEYFDLPIRSELANMAKDQTGAFVYQWKAGRMTIHQVKIKGQFKWFIYDHRIKDWQPPQQVMTAAGFFERKGTLYATDADDDAVYSIFTAFDDNGVDIFCQAYTGSFKLGSAKVHQVTASGIVTHAAKIQMKTYVTNKRSGKRSGSPKIINGADYSYDDDHSVGAVPAGASASTGDSLQYAHWDETMDVFPSEGHTVQFGVTNEAGGYFRLSTYSISGTLSSSSLTPSL